MEKQKVIVYVDGFNFYYGLKSDHRWKRYYWLDLVSLFEKFIHASTVATSLILSRKRSLMSESQLKLFLMPMRRIAMWPSSFLPTAI